MPNLQNLYRGDLKDPGGNLQFRELEEMGDWHKGLPKGGRVQQTEEGAALPQINHEEVIHPYLIIFI